MPLYNMYGGLESLKNTSSQFPLFAVVRFPALAAVSGGQNTKMPNGESWPTRQTQSG